MPCSGVSVATATISCPFATVCMRLKHESFPPDTSPITLCLMPGSLAAESPMVAMMLVDDEESGQSLARDQTLTTSTTGCGHCRTISASAPFNSALS